MSQLDLGLNLSTKRTRKREFLDEMTRVVGGFNRWMQHNIPKSATVAPLTAREDAGSNTVMRPRR
jgi:hypothetical protein